MVRTGRTDHTDPTVQTGHSVRTDQVWIRKRENQSTKPFRMDHMDQIDNGDRTVRLAPMAFGDRMVQVLPFHLLEDGRMDLMVQVHLGGLMAT